MNKWKTRKHINNTRMRRGVCNTNNINMMKFNSSMMYKYSSNNNKVRKMININNSTYRRYRHRYQ